MHNTRLLVVTAIALALTACATSQVTRSAFSKPRTLALVTVSASVSGLATSEAEDKGIAKGLVRVTMNEIGRSPHIRLAPEAKVLSSKAYKALKDKGPPMMSVLAPGYKRVDVDEEKANIRALAKEINVDGVLIVMGAFGKKASGIGIGGLLNAPIPITAGKAYASATYVVVAYDANGNVIWQDQAERSSENGIVTVMGVGRYNSLIPELTDLAKSASRDLVAKLRTQIASR